MVPRRRAPAAPLSRRSSSSRHSSARSRAKTIRRRPAVRLGDPARILAGVVAVACAIALGWISLGSTPAIGSVEVAGARHIRTGQAVAQSGLLDTPAFLASAADASAHLRALPAVKAARVEIALPSGARITLVEREAVGRWVAGDGLEWFVDAEGVLFPSADPNAAPQLRVVDERGTRRAGERLDPALVQVALRVAAIAPGELRADATAPRAVMTTGSSGLVLRFGTGWEIRFGGPEAFDDKLALVKRYLQDTPTRRLDYVDVRSPDRIVVSPR